jgi:hypothetical protein
VLGLTPALDKNGHVYDLRASVAAQRILSADEVERRHTIRVDHCGILLFQVSSQGIASVT